MLNADNIKDAEQRRLAWRCRRGMLELDILLERFLASYFERLNLDELRAFDAFLDLPDTEFWNILQMKNLHAKSLAQQSILDKLHALEGA